VATLYVRNVPAELYAKLQTWATESGRSINAVVLDALEQEAERRHSDAEFERALAKLKEYPPLVGPPWPEDIIREHRYGREPGFGD
jgi:plasmid stability protein